jgi:hypothetical protein
MLSAIALTLCLVGRSSGYTDCRVAAADAKQLSSLLRARDTGELEKTYDSIGNRTIATDVIFAVRFHQLTPGKGAARRLIEVMPRNDLDLRLLFSLTDPELLEVDEHLGDAVNTYIEMSARSVLAVNEGFARFLQLNRFADGEVAERVHDWTEFLFEHNRKAVLEALRTLSPSTQRRVCGSCRILADPNTKELR